MIGAPAQESRIEQAISRFQDQSTKKLEKAAAADPKKVEELRQAAQGFESVFIQMLLKSMRSTVQKSGFLDGGRGEEIFTGVMDQNFADAASSQNGGIGLAKMIIERYSKYVSGSEESKGRRLDVTAGAQE